MTNQLPARLRVQRAGNLLENSATVYTATHRYLLTHRWTPASDPAPLAVFILLNPSTATATVDDPTVRRCRGFARREQCGGLVIVNLFALRATNPRALAGHPDPIGEHNDRFLTAYTRAADGPVIAGWGAHGHLHHRATTVTGRLRQAGVSLLCLGLTKTGQPRHPLYLPRTAPLHPWPDTGIWKDHAA
jgi:hypothetical protein